MDDLDDDLTVDELDAFEASSHGSPEFEERMALVIEVRRHRARIAADKERRAIRAYYAARAMAGVKRSRVLVAQ